MSNDADQLNVVHNPDASRFEVRLGDDLAVIEYKMVDGDIAFTHTEVPPAFEGMGVGAKLAQVALDYAQAEGMTVQALCPFVNSYVKRHAAYQPITRGFM
ncbi:MAG: GNAT family N-acetyltransferase [Chloroflexota bacterium]|nr:GNAT family N-acetyltransferase [Chloroflexota bacterium]